MPSNHQPPKARIIACLTPQQLEYLNERCRTLGIGRSEYLRRIIDADMRGARGSK